MTYGYDEIKNEVSHIWQRVLQREDIDTEISLFDLGGNSILLMKVFLEIENKFFCKLSITDLFAYSSISKLAKYIHTKLLQNQLPKYVRLPDCYFVHENMGMMYLQFNNLIKEASLKILKSMALNFGVDLYCVLTTLLLRKFSDVCEQDTVDFLVVEKDVKHMQVIHIDFSRSLTLEEYCHSIEQQLEQRERVVELSVDDVRTYSSNLQLNDVLPVLVIGENILEDINITEIPCIFFQFEVSQSKIVVSCKFDANRLDEYEMEKFIESYLKESYEKDLSEGDENAFE